jgi:hypothetical protein
MFFDELITMIGRRSRRSWQLAWPGVPKGCTSRMRTLDISGHVEPKPPSADGQSESWKFAVFSR